MTNNPTIDGVSRELLIDCVAYLQGSHRAEVNVCIRLLRDLLERDADTSLIPGAHEFKDAPAPTKADYQKIGAALVRITDFPAVERQEPEVDDEKWWADTPDGDSALFTRVGALTEWQKGRDAMRNERESALNEVAALQSTIAQLQARIDGLESGREEPVAWETVGVNEFGLECRKAVTETKPAIESVWLLWGDKFTITQRPLFTAPSAPAPAPVAIDENSEFEKWVTAYAAEINYTWPELVLKRDGDCYATTWVDSASIGWQARACLDATAALNWVKS